MLPYCEYKNAPFIDNVTLIVDKAIYILIESFKEGILLMPYKDIAKELIIIFLLNTENGVCYKVAVLLKI
jgi:hypothetical protein